MSNRKTGTAFERELCEELFSRGYWVHNMAQNSSGQPFDIIAARNGNTYVIDAKDCSKDVFSLSRIEENQYWAMTLWTDRGNSDGWFALKLSSGEIYMICFSAMKILRERGIKTLNADSIKAFGWGLENWIREL